MEAKLHTKLAEKTSRDDRTWRELIFSIHDALRALPYVSRVVQDAKAAFCRIQNCRTGLELQTGARQRQALCDDRDRSIQQLNAAIDECNAVGVDLVNIPNGVVRFAGQIDGRPVSFVWRADESVDDAWRELR